MTAKSGNLTEVAKAFAVSRTTIHDWINRDKKFRQIQQDVKESLLDFTESQAKILMTGIPKIEEDEEGKKKIVGWKERPDTALIIWTQKTLGKERGYIERSEITGKDGKALMPKQEIDYSKLSDKVLDEIIEASQNKGQ